MSKREESGNPRNREIEVEIPQESSRLQAEECQDEAIGVIPKTMTNHEPPDYAALIRAVTPNSERKHPEWLDPGQQLFSPKYGQGEVISWMGNTLIEPIWDLG
ncbi:MULTISPECIES: hypothetical protein [unclassified Microcoleus]|uniref:hypothetical protein n=1 Tax=unclassified Microcoleus TaxID=2642155 RepID=UPI002FD20803